MLSYRAVSAWDKLIELYQRMPKPLQAHHDGAGAIRPGAQPSQPRGRGRAQSLRNLITARGPSSETNGLLGRIYKDRWDEAQKAAGERFPRRPAN